MVSYPPLSFLSFGSSQKGAHNIPLWTESFSLLFLGWSLRFPSSDRFSRPLCVDRDLGAVYDLHKQRIFGRLGAIRSPVLQALAFFSARIPRGRIHAHLGYEDWAAPRPYARALVRRSLCSTSSFDDARVASRLSSHSSSAKLRCPPAPPSKATRSCTLRRAHIRRDVHAKRLHERATSRLFFTAATKYLTTAEHFQSDNIPLVRTQVVDLVHPQCPGRVR